MSNSTNALAGVGSGRNRKPFVIKEWMYGRRLTQAEVAKSLDVNKAVVSRTIFGSANNRRVLAFLRDAGCPINALALPMDLQEAIDQ